MAAKKKPAKKKKCWIVHIFDKKGRADDSVVAGPFFSEVAANNACEKILKQTGWDRNRVEYCELQPLQVVIVAAKELE